MGAYAFSPCYDLNTVTIASNSQMKSIGKSAFDGCTSLKSIVLPEKLESIGYRAFYNCESLVIFLESESELEFDSNWNDISPYYYLSEVANIIKKENFTIVIDDNANILLAKYFAVSYPNPFALPVIKIFILKNKEVNIK